MNNKINVFGIFPSVNAADRCLGQLRNASFRNTDISVLIPDGGAKQQGGDKQSKASASGVQIDGQLSWLAGTGPLNVQGLGSFIAAGPVRSALANAGASTSLAAGLAAFGVPEHDAKRYDSRLRSGNILLACQCDGPEWVTRAQDALQNCGAEDIATSSEVPADYMKTGQSQQPRYGATR